MRIVKSAVLYTALALVANVAIADPAALREGDMMKLMFHSSPMDASDTGFIREDGTDGSLADYQGKIVLVNFWATWCAPCREEMPSLSALQTELGGEDFEVVTIATGPNPAPAMTRFFDEIGVDNLPLHTDPRQGFARSMGVMGLPVTVILDRDGMEIARLQGDADWSSDSARAVIGALVGDTPGE